MKFKLVPLLISVVLSLIIVSASLTSKNASYDQDSVLGAHGSNLGRNKSLGRAKKSTPTPTARPIPTDSPVPTGTNRASLTWGAWVSWRVSEVNDFQSRVGKKMNYVVTFVHWGNEQDLPLDLGNLAKSNGQTLVLYWEAMDYNFNGPNDPRFSYDAILRGDWDSYLVDFASQAKNFGGPVVLIPFEEMNGDWYPWSGTQNGNSAEKHVSAYRYLRKFFNGVDNVKFGWTVNSESSPNTTGNQIADYYPGDEYVDIVGVNGFNFGDPWVTWAQLFNPGLGKIEVYNKPAMIFSMACVPADRKTEWITTGLGSEIYKHPKVIGWIWFNENKERDWRVWSDPNSLAAFQGILP